MEKFLQQIQVMENGANNKLSVFYLFILPFFHVKVKATADISTAAGKGSSSVHVRADGKDRMKLDAQMSHSLQRGDRAVGLKMNLSQSLLPSATDLHVNMAANMSSDRCVHPPSTHWLRGLSLSFCLYQICSDDHISNKQC